MPASPAPSPSAPPVRRKLAYGALAGLALLAWACDVIEDDPTGTGSELDGALLESLARDAIAPTYDTFAEEAAALETATTAYADAVGTAEAETALADAREAWRVAMRAWQAAEPMQIGPAGTIDVRIGGESLRDEVYSWPSTNPCRVDQELVAQGYAEADFIETRLVNAYGLDALEYLLFHDGADNACAPQLPINADGEWDALDPGELAKRRADYAAAAAAGVADTAETLRAALGTGGTWTEHLATAGTPDSAYASAREALHEVYAAMFYLDGEVKDQKLAKPAGLLDCSADTCPEALEATYADASKDAVSGNLVGFSRLYFAGDDRARATGFDDVLVDVGADAVEMELTAAVDAAGETVADMDDSFSAALANDPAVLDQPHAAVKRITDIFKGDFPVALMLEVPREGGGDAD